MANYKFYIYNDNLEPDKETTTEQAVCLMAYGDGPNTSFDLLYISKDIPNYAELCLTLKNYLNLGLIKLGDLDMYQP